MDKMVCIAISLTNRGEQEIWLSLQKPDNWL
ncbi:hypothetical protein N476_05275 [Pseudoalteromonas luteoviolacea H33]|uniref:Uncharacterized protein n=1 Tax=Pseudoalteromonas luteoviolacea H33 TaxID=1365251 RepID=A0A167AIM6_9GAMM|nr:hypothetical protein N476_05275 [Pseudoalteromonas luteoviolacea H33]KZN70705.1 hypothetical protein N477_04765 [Pseudoalteromonas luteoviolacea H33-S]